MEPNSRKLALRVLAGFLVLILPACGIAVWNTIRTRSAAREILRDIGDLQVGEATFANAQRITQKYSQYLLGSSEPCSPMSCRFSFGFDNRWLSKTGLTPLTTFTAQLYVARGKVTWTELMLATDPVTKVFVEEYPSGTQTSTFLAGGKLITVHPLPHAILIDVKFTSDANPIQKNAAMAFDLNCLTKLGGCKYERKCFHEFVWTTPPQISRPSIARVRLVFRRPMADLLFEMSV
jgi:hypothetical protein